MSPAWSSASPSGFGMPTAPHPPSWSLRLVDKAGVLKVSRTCASRPFELPVARWRRSPLERNITITELSVEGSGRRTATTRNCMESNVSVQTIHPGKTSETRFRCCKSRTVQWHTWVRDTPHQGASIWYQTFPCLWLRWNEGGRKQGGSSKVEERREEVGKQESPFTC